MENRSFAAGPEDEDTRLDLFLAESTDYSRSYIQKLIKTDHVVVDNAPVTKPGFLIHEGQWVSLSVPPAEEIEIKPEPMDLNIVYEDDDVILIDKPKGMVIHPAPGHSEHTLVNGLLYHCKGNLSGINGVLRPGIVHRIDRDTTGIVIACKNDMAHRDLAEQFAGHTINRRYQAIVYNNFHEDDGTIDKPIGRDVKNRKRMAVVSNGSGRRAITHYHVIDHLNNRYNHIECRLETGRTHQIRVHMSYIRHPLLGDTVYGPNPDSSLGNLEGQTLHAGILGFIHPKTHQYMEFSSELPQYFVGLLNRLKKQ